jgi:hypothetical protein
MEEEAEGINWNARMIVIAMIMLVAYNISYLGYRLSWLGETYVNVIHDNLGLFTVLEFLAVASIAIDVILRWDVLGYWDKRLRLAIAILMAMGFGVKLVAHIMALYTEGGV